MRIAVYQFASSETISDNLWTIGNAAKTAAKQNVRILVLHECALCGYPPIETDIRKISAGDIENALTKISDLTKKFKIYIAVGTIRFEENKKFNSVIIFDDFGKQIGYYDKKTLWGWDSQNFTKGSNPDIFEIDGIKIGFRICYDIRFPELFRELYENGVSCAFVNFSDTSDTPDKERYNIIKSHLITRAVENVVTVVSVNSISRNQTAPTAVFDPNGRVVAEAEINKEQLLVYDYEIPKITFSMQGRIENSNHLVSNAEK